MIKIKAVGNIEEEKVDIEQTVLNGSDGEIMAIIVSLIAFYVDDEKKTYNEVIDMIKDAWEWRCGNL
jgi:hypothetical protein|nr:MAG TPA_asm: hypothetical protein [Caudoviricetes sp.]